MSSDGNKLVFYERASGTVPFELSSVHVDGTAYGPLSYALVSGGAIQDYAIAPDSQNVVYRADGMVDILSELKA